MSTQKTNFIQFLKVIWELRAWEQCVSNPREPFVFTASLACHGSTTVNASQAHPAKLPPLSVPASSVSPVIAVKVSAVWESFV